MRVGPVVVGVAVAFTLTACAESGSETNVSAGDLPSITDSPPQESHGWEEDNANDPHVVTLDLLRHWWTTPSAKSALTTLESAGFRRGRVKYWTGRAGDGQANASVLVLLFNSSSGATSGLEALQNLSHSTASGGGAAETSPGELGDESWILHVTGGDETFVYGFRSGNVVAITDMTCVDDTDAPCAPEGALADAARAYADEVARRAENASEHASNGTASDPSLVLAHSSNGAATGELHGTIVFDVTAERPGKYESVFVSQIYSIGADGRGLRRLTETAAINSAPAWSPDGRKIAYLSYRTGVGMTLWVMNADGTAKRRVSAQPVTNGQVLPIAADYVLHIPRWSPDGKWIAFTRDSSGTRGRATIRLAKADGTSERAVTRGSDVRGRWAAGDAQPSWSPDGTSIAFVRGGEVWIARADGTQAHVVARGGWAGAPVPVTWSPRGRWIGFVSRGAELWVVRPDGTDKHRLAKWPIWEFAWSPDGMRIAYPGCRKPDGDDCGYIRVVRLAGKGHLELITDGRNDAPAWSPDGKAIAYRHSEDDERGSLRLMKVGAEVSAEVVDTEGRVGTVSWQPSP